MGVCIVTCYTKGVHESHRHLYPCHEPIVSRSPEDFRKDAISAEQEKKPVNGIKGRCFLDEIIQIPIDVPIDAMHQVFLGCGKSIIRALVGSLTKKEISVVEDRIKNIKCPRSFNCKPKSISELMYWKARDFKFFLFHFGSFCLEGLVKEDFQRSFSHLSLSIRLLSLKMIEESHIKAGLLRC